MNGFARMPRPKSLLAFSAVACAAVLVLRWSHAAEPEPVMPRPAVAPNWLFCPCPSCVPWECGGPGEYVERARTAHVPVYRLRVDDQLRCVYRLTRNESSRPYELNVGDEIAIQSFTDDKLNRTGLIIQPDGTVSLSLLGQIKAAHHTVEQLRQQLDHDYSKFYKNPSITVMPVRVNSKLDDLRNTVDARAGTGGQGIDVRVTPDGTISLPALGPVPVQGMTLEDLKQEIDARYAVDIQGIEVTPILTTRAPRFVFVLGEVKLPGRYVLDGPTTVMQAIAMAGSWNVGAHLKQVVVFRRGDDWRLMATMVDLHAALGGKEPCPAGEIWIGDSDVILVPKSAILKADDFINLAFTRGAYAVFPFSSSFTFGTLSSVVK
jgi:polysaccharide export outer membrane protein